MTEASARPAAKLSAAELFGPHQGPGTLVVSDQLLCRPPSKPWAAVVRGYGSIYTVLFRATHAEASRHGHELRIGVR